MKLVDSEYDDLLKSNYELYSVRFSELKDTVKSWYKGQDLKDFDDRTKHEWTYRDDSEYFIAKVSGIASNHFYAYKEGDKYYLMDGFNRLLTDYAEDLPVDPIVYIKILTSELSDARLMNVMFRLNMWKIARSGDRDSEFKVHNFLDRGFRLFLKSKFGIKFQKRFRHDDMSVMAQYFKDESESCCYFSYRLPELFKLFFNERIIDDFKQILKFNEYEDDNPPFNHYDTFFEGYIRFLSKKRVNDDESDYDFEDYLKLLKEDEKFFKKLQKMSWTDSTRKNVYKFFKDSEINKK